MKNTSSLKFNPNASYLFLGDLKDSAVVQLDGLSIKELEILFYLAAVVFDQQKH